MSKTESQKVTTVLPPNPQANSGKIQFNKVKDIFTDCNFLILDP